MNMTKFAIDLVEEYGLSHKDALYYLLEGDMDKAAKKMAKKVYPDDDDKQKELEAKFKEKMRKMKNK